MEAALHERGAITRQHLSAAVHDRLLADIIHGHYLPGDRLNVREIAGSLSVSVAPVREALTRLHNCGFVHVHFHSSTVVSSWTVQDMHDRVALLGRVLNLMLEDPRLDLVDITRQVLMTSQAMNNTAAQTVLSLAKAVAAYASNRVAAYVSDGLIFPLALFLEHDTLTRHGADTHELDRTLTAIVSDLTDAVETGSADQIPLITAVGIAAIDSTLTLAARGR